MKSVEPQKTKGSGSQGFVAFEVDEGRVVCG